MADDNFPPESREDSIIAFQDTIESSRIIADTASDAIITINEESRILFVNRAAVNIFGHSIEEMLGSELTMLMPEYLRHLHRAGLKHYVETGKKHISWNAVELPGLHKNGKEISLELSFGEFSKDGRRFFTGIARDISKRKQDERRLDLQHSVIEILAAAANLPEAAPKVLQNICEKLNWQFSGFWTFDRQRDEMVLLKHWRDEALASAAEFETTSLETRFPSGVGLPGRVWASKKSIWSADFGADNLPRSAVAARDNLHSAFGFPVMRGDEVLGVIELFSTELKEPDALMLDSLAAIGRQLGQFIERKDGERELVAALERAHEARLEAEAANKAKDEFLTILSHELRTPLTPIIGWVHMMQNGILPDTDFSKVLTVVNRNAYSLKRLINDLLDMSAILSGKMRIEKAPVRVAAVLEESVETMRPYARDSKVKLRLKIANNAARVIIKGDRTRLNQAFCNIIHNAIKFSPPGAWVQASLEQTATEAVVAIKDEGGGISGEFMPHIFERFRQADGSRTRAFGGLGLGLALVKSFVEAHGGTVEANSEGQAKGSVFTVKLPRDVTRLNGVENADGRSESVRGAQRTRILIVEDQPDTLAMLAATFESKGYETIACNSAAEALSVAGREHFDVLVSDIAMPEMDGLELITNLRRQKGLEYFAAIALTGYASQKDVDAATAAGFDMHLPKPIDPSELAAAVERLFSLKLDTSQVK